MKTQLTFVLVLCCLHAMSQTAPSKEIQIKTAVMAAPEDQREKATVYGYDEKGEFTIIRQGSNLMVCLTDDPASPGLNVSCYHKDLDPFMERGRVLKKEGKSVKEVFDTREAEVKTGKLAMPKQPTTLFSYNAKPENYNAATGEVKSGNLRYVIYIPYATAQSTGLPLKPEAPGMPWIMDPGTHRAHIMINPPEK